jgi:hypothetical protein
MSATKRNRRGQYVEGKSGNERGRPTDASRRPPIHRRQVRTDFFEAAYELITITVEGKRKKVTRIRALFELEFADALSGRNKMSRKRLIDLYIRLSAEQEDTQAEIMRVLLENEAAELRKAGKDISPVDSLFEKMKQDERRRASFEHYLRTGERLPDDDEASEGEEKAGKP